MIKADDNSLLKRQQSQKFGVSHVIRASGLTILGNASFSSCRLWFAPGVTSKYQDLLPAGVNAFAQYSPEPPAISICAGADQYPDLWQSLHGRWQHCGPRVQPFLIGRDKDYTCVE